ncbi:hypothetical protein Pla144_13510 [Bythopirellula polymerisocia]|uniref:Uncharacterized protein n=1 Tax=Bythopirellula polymerisocia TaxID=2528003 RepID=A0A5C6CWH4_9BACT|nr:hypothetical protein Pla144_13510 [Bythopirellula polymerisocia]
MKNVPDRVAEANAQGLQPLGVPQKRITKQALILADEGLFRLEMSLYRARLTRRIRFPH